MVLIESGGKPRQFVADLMPTAAHLRPTWIPGCDLYPMDTLAAKHAFVKEAVDRDMLVFFELTIRRWRPAGSWSRTGSNAWIAVTRARTADGRDAPRGGHHGAGSVRRARRASGPQRECRRFVVLASATDPVARPVRIP